MEEGDAGASDDCSQQDPRSKKGDETREGGHQDGSLAPVDNPGDKDESSTPTEESPDKSSDKSPKESPEKSPEKSPDESPDESPNIILTSPKGVRGSLRGSLKQSPPTLQLPDDTVDGDGDGGDDGAMNSDEILPFPFPEGDLLNPTNKPEMPPGGYTRSRTKSAAELLAALTRETESKVYELFAKEEVKQTSSEAPPKTKQPKLRWNSSAELPKTPRAPTDNQREDFVMLPLFYIGSGMITAVATDGGDVFIGSAQGYLHKYSLKWGTRLPSESTRRNSAISSLTSNNIPASFVEKIIYQVDPVEDVDISPYHNNKGKSPVISLEVESSLKIIFCLCNGKLVMYDMKSMGYLGYIKGKGKTSAFVHRIENEMLTVCLAGNRRLLIMQSPTAFHPPQFKTVQELFIPAAPTRLKWMSKNELCVAFKNEYNFIKTDSGDVKSLPRNSGGSAMIETLPEDQMLLGFGDNAIAYYVDKDRSKHLRRVLKWHTQPVSIGTVESCAMSVFSDRLLMHKMNCSDDVTQGFSLVQTIDIKSTMPNTALLCANENFVLASRYSQLYFLQSISKSDQRKDERWIARLQDDIKLDGESHEELYVIKEGSIESLTLEHLEGVFASPSHPFSHMATCFSRDFVSSLRSHKEVWDVAGLIDEGRLLSKRELRQLANLPLRALVEVVGSQIMEFKQRMVGVMNSQWRVISKQPGLLVSAEQVVDDCIFKQVGDIVTSLYRLNHAQEDTDFCTKVATMQHLLPTHFGSTLDFGDDSFKLHNRFQEVAVLCSQISTMETPKQKLGLMEQVQQDAIKAAEDFWMERKKERLLIAADDLIPILCYVVVQSQVTHPFAESAYTMDFLHEDDKLGRAGYVITSFQIAIRHILSEATSTFTIAVPRKRTQELSKSRRRPSKSRSKVRVELEEPFGDESTSYSCPGDYNHDHTPRSSLVNTPTTPTFGSNFSTLVNLSNPLKGGLKRSDLVKVPVDKDPLRATFIPMVAHPNPATEGEETGEEDEESDPEMEVFLVGTRLMAAVEIREGYF